VYLGRMTNTMGYGADPLSALPEIRRVLTENGRVYTTGDTLASWTRPLPPASDYLDMPLTSPH